MFKKHTRSKKFVLTLLLLPVLSFAGFAATTYFFGVLSPSTNIGALTTASQGLSGEHAGHSRCANRPNEQV